MGDGGSGGDPENRAQNPDSLLGKILRLDPARPATRPVIVADGVRNPWRFSFDRSERRSLDRRRRPGLDRGGRPRRLAVDRPPELRLERLRGHVDVRGQGRSARDKLVKPVAQYSHEHGCSITGGYVYRGTAVPAAAGRYFYGDYCSGTVWSLKLVGRDGDRQIRPEPFKVASLTSFGQDKAGELYAVSGAGHDLPPRRLAPGRPSPARGRKPASTRGRRS